MEKTKQAAQKPAYLILENGKVFKGVSRGAEKDAVAEIVFTTSMTGYLETLTDKSYYGQAIVQTFPLIGNYGVIPEDFEGGKIRASAYITRYLCDNPSNFRMQGLIDDFLKSEGIPAITGIDTRALTRIIRESGVMNGMITTDPARTDTEKIKAYRIKDALKNVSTGKYYVEQTGKKWRVAVMDYGFKENILRMLRVRDCELHIFPYDAPAAEVMKIAPDGILLTNGPGDPAENTASIQTVKELTKTGVPIFGICLGHQLLALSLGFKTEKLKYGHRGGNQPVKNLETGRIYITSQNHGYAVMSDSVDKSIARQSYINNNDGTDEGLDYLKIPAFSVQFHPEARGGPLDTGFLFDRFVKMMEGKKNAVK